MKRLLCLVMFAALLCACAFAEAPAAADDPILGTWYMREISLGGPMMDNSGIGMDAVLVIRPDMTVTMTTNGLPSFGDWRREGDRYIVAGEQVTLEDGRLVLTSDFMNAVFTREPVEFRLPAPVPADSEEAFLGDWALEKVGMNGVIMPVDAAPELLNSGEKEIRMSFTPGKAGFVWDDLPEWRFETSLADGRMELALIGTDVTNTQFSAVELTDEGSIMLALGTPSYTEPVTIYLKKVTPEE